MLSHPVAYYTNVVHYKRQKRRFGMSKSHNLWSKEIKEEIYNLEKIAEKLRENDIYFKLEIEERTMLNAIGKILGELAGTLRVYQYKDDEEKLEIRKKIIGILKYFEVKL